MPVTLRLNIFVNEANNNEYDLHFIERVSQRRNENENKKYR